jgi:hypothetical protein
VCATFVKNFQRTSHLVEFGNELRPRRGRCEYPVQIDEVRVDVIYPEVRGQLLRIVRQKIEANCPCSEKWLEVFVGTKVKFWGQGLSDRGEEASFAASPPEDGLVCLKSRFDQVHQAILLHRCDSR